MDIYPEKSSLEIKEEEFKHLSQFEVDILRELRRKKVRSMATCGSITIHYNAGLKPASVEKREIYS